MKYLHAKCDVYDFLIPADHIVEVIDLKGVSLKINRVVENNFLRSALWRDSSIDFLSLPVLIDNTKHESSREAIVVSSNSFSKQGSNKHLMLGVHHIDDLVDIDDQRMVDIPVGRSMLHELLKKTILNPETSRWMYELNLPINLSRLKVMKKIQDQ